MNTNVVQMVNAIMHEKFEVPADSLVATAHLKDDLKLDSLDFVDMVVILEEKIGGQMPAIDFFSIRTLGDVYNLVGSIMRSKDVSTEL